MPRAQVRYLMSPSRARATGERRSSRLDPGPQSRTMGCWSNDRYTMLVPPFLTDDEDGRFPLAGTSAPKQIADANDPPVHGGRIGRQGEFRCAYAWWLQEAQPPTARSSTLSLSAHPRPGRFLAHTHSGYWWPWLIPPCVFVAVMLSPRVGLPVLLAAAAGLGLIAVFSRHPGAALVALVWFLPLQIPIFSLLYQHGVNGEFLRSAGSIKEALGLAVVVAAARELLKGRSRLAFVDKIVLAFVGALLIYLVLPMVVSGSTYPHAFSDRLLGFRLDGGFLLLFVAVRHAPITERWRRLFFASVLSIAGLFAVVGLYQFLQPDSFRDIITNDLAIPTFQIEILHTPAAAVAQSLRFATDSPIRVGSLFLSPFDFADFLLLPAALLLIRVTARRARSWEVVLLLLIIAALLASQTRVNAFAVGVMTLLALTPSPQRTVASRLRVFAIALLVTVALVPSFASSRLGGVGTSAKSSSEHVDEIQKGLHLIGEQPLGSGLGTAPALAVRLGGAPVVVSDNSILQVGNELGVGMMVLFVAVLLTTLVMLGRATRAGPSNDYANAAKLALIGLLLAGMLHHVFQAFAITWILWAAIGLALPIRASDGGEQEDVAESTSVGGRPTIP